MKMKITRTVMIFTTVLLLSGGLVAYATSTLFTQTFPSQTFNTASLVQGTACSGGNLVIYAGDSTIPKFAGSPAVITYGCDSTGSTAFSTTGTTSNTVTATPTITTLPTGWTLTAVPFTNSLCTGTSLTSGSPATLTGGTNYYYCLSTTSASNFTSFAITWAQ